MTVALDATGVWCALGVVVARNKPIYAGTGSRDERLTDHVGWVAEHDDGLDVIAILARKWLSIGNCRAAEGVTDDLSTLRVSQENDLLVGALLDGTLDNALQAVDSICHRGSVERVATHLSGIRGALEDSTDAGVKDGSEECSKGGLTKNLIAATDADDTHRCHAVGWSSSGERDAEQKRCRAEESGFGEHGEFDDFVMFVVFGGRLRWMF